MRLLFFGGRGGGLLSTYVYVGGFDEGALRMYMVIQNHQANHHPQHE
jgi:hypothetical protein